MNNFRNKLMTFMYGRNGADSLYKAGALLYLGLFAVNIFLRSNVITIIIWALFIWSMFRFFSKNIYKRQAENRKFLDLAAIAGKRLSMAKTILTDKQHCYKKCRHCKTYLRLPRTSGEHTAICPVCREKITVKIR